MLNITLKLLPEILTTLESRKGCTNSSDGHEPDRNAAGVELGDHDA